MVLKITSLYKRHTRHKAALRVPINGRGVTPRALLPAKRYMLLKYDSDRAVRQACRLNAASLIRVAMLYSWLLPLNSHSKSEAVVPRESQHGCSLSLRRRVQAACVFNAILVSMYCFSATALLCVES